MGFLNFVASLRPGNDHELAATQYAGQQSASDKAAQKRRAGHRARVAREGDQPSRNLRRGLI